MKCEEIFRRLSEYIDHELDASVCDEIESHVQDCEPCIAFINTLRKTVELYNQAGERQMAAAAPAGVSRKLKDYLREHCEAEGQKG